MEHESPDPSRPGEIVSMGATLVRSDTWSPLSGKYIRVEGSNDGGATWWDAGYYPTDGNGRASGGVVFSSVGENQWLRARFEGDSEFGPSVSNLEPHATRDAPAPPPDPPPTIGTAVWMEPESPDPSRPGDMVVISAVLMRTDTWTPLAGQFVHIEGQDYDGQAWWHAGYYWTDANGRAVGGTRFMFAHENQRLRATFDGDSQFAWSQSAPEPHATREAAGSMSSSGLPIDPSLPDLSIAAIGALVTPTIALSLIRRRRGRIVAENLASLMRRGPRAPSPEGRHVK
jgi:hypothetical protein